MVQIVADMLGAGALVDAVRLQHAVCQYSQILWCGVVWYGAGGYADLRRVTQWNLDFMAKADEGQAYLELSRQIDAAIKFMVACGLEYSHPIMTETDFHVGHECLLLDYEQVRYFVVVL